MNLVFLQLAAGVIVPIMSVTYVLQTYVLQTKHSVQLTSSKQCQL